MIITDTKGSSRKKFTMEIGDNLEDAKARFLQAFAGELCENGHKVTTANGEPLNKSVRFTSTKKCVKCTAAGRKAEKPQLNSEGARQNRTRRRVEDLKIALKCGVDVEVIC